MEKLSLRKKLLVVRLYLAGLSYSEIAAKASVSKGAVAAIVAELKAGQLPGIGDITDQVEVLRDLSVGLKQSQVTPVQAVVGLAVLSHLDELGVEPKEVAQVVAVCHDLAGEKGDPKAFIKAALALEEAKKQTGLGIDELESKVKGLQEAAAQLEPQASKAKEMEQHIAKLDANEQELTHEVSALTDQRAALKKDIALKEQREEVLTARVAALEEKGHVAEVQLASARQDMKTLAKIGFSVSDLSVLTKEVQAIAKHHGLGSGAVSKRLFDELMKLNKVLGLEAVIKARQGELQKVENDISEAKKQQAAIKAANAQLLQEQSGLKAVAEEVKKHIAANLHTIEANTQEAMAMLKKDLAAGMQESLGQVGTLKNKALELGKQMGQIESAIGSNEWLTTLHALISGEDHASPSQVRVVSLTLMKAISTWLASKYQGSTAAAVVGASISKAALEFEQWTP